jgi:WD40 repeat protein
MVKDRNKPEATSRLSLRHTYVSKSPVDFAGHCNLGGKDDQLVLCAGKGALIGLPSIIPSAYRQTYTLSTAGDIHIWDRESGTLLHHVRAQSLGGGDLTCVAWNPAADPFMFATGSHDGAVRIWTAVPVPSRDRRGRSGSVTPLSDTSSHLHLDLEPRTECLTGRQRFEHTLLRVETPYVGESSEDAAGPSSGHTFAFTTPQGLGISCRPSTPV